MSNPNPTITDTLEGVQTPYCLTGETDPRTYLSGLGQWPSLPFKGLGKVMPAALRKKVAGFMAERAELLDIQAKNDVGFARRKMLQAARDGSDDGAFQSEVIAREIRDMDLEAYGRATTRLREIAQETQQIAADFATSAAEGILPSFIEEAKAAELRLNRFNRALSEDRIIDGFPCTKHALHLDEILNGIFADYWFLAHYWGGENGQFMKPSYDSRVGLDWLNSCLGD
jgi:hypothetical protein